MGKVLLDRELLQADLRDLFEKLTDFKAHDFQVEVARRLLEGENVVLVSPTGSGKSWAALLAFIYARQNNMEFADRLIYAFPLRTLTTALYQQYTPYLDLDEVGLKATLQIGGMERGEGDAFFDKGDVIFTTIDQLLSSYIGVPVSLPRRLANMPAGALVGSCVVFDEFHLLEPDKALATTLDLADRLKPYAQTLLMSATFSGSGIDEIQKRAHASKCEVSPEHIKHKDRVATRRKFIWVGQQLSAEAVLDAHTERSIAVCNTVDRATDLYRDLVTLAEERGIKDQILLLHARFLPEDRKAIEAELLRLFEKGSTERAILVATQVVEVGLDISAESFHTEAAPANAVFQRAGRCARFGGDGTVYVYDLPTTNHGRNTAPYLGRTQAPLVEATINELANKSGGILGFDEERAILDKVHSEADLHNLKSVGRRALSLDVAKAIRDGGGSHIRSLVREVDTINLIVHSNPKILRMELPLLSVSLSRSVARKFLGKLSEKGQLGQASIPSTEDSQEASENYVRETVWKPVDKIQGLGGSFYLCLPPELASYDPSEGLVLGRPGERIFEQKAEELPYEPYSYRKETWRDHIVRVMEQYKSQQRGHRVGTARLAKHLGMEEEAVERMGLLVAALHDLGKLSAQWQDTMWLWQQSVKPNEPREGFLGHSDFDGSNRGQRQRMKESRFKKPPHAVESYYAGLRVLQRYLDDEPEDVRSEIVRALGSAIAQHHYAFARNMREFKLKDGYKEQTNTILEQFGLDANLSDQPKLAARKEFSLNCFVDPAKHKNVFPLYRFVVRRLRLADQKSNDW